MFEARNKSAEIQSPQRQLVQSIVADLNDQWQRSGVDKENYDRENICNVKEVGKTLAFDQKVKPNAEQDKLKRTEPTQQSMYISTNLSLSGVHFSDQTPYTNQNNKTINIESPIFGNCIDSMLSKMQEVHPNSIQLKECFKWEMEKLQMQKEYSKRQLEISEKNIKEKQKMRMEANTKYNKLWEEHNKQSQTVIHLELQNRRLNYEVEKLAHQLESQKKIGLRMIEDTSLASNRQKEQLTQIMSKQLQRTMSQKDKLIQKISQQRFELKETIQKLYNDKQQMQTKMRQKLNELEQQRQEMKLSLKKHYQKKCILAEQRHQSQLLALENEHSLTEQLLIEANEKYEELIERKSVTISNLLIFVEQLNESKINYQQNANGCSEECEQSLEMNMSMWPKRNIAFLTNEELSSKFQQLISHTSLSKDNLHKRVVKRLNQQMEHLAKQNQHLQQELFKAKQYSLETKRDKLIYRNCDLIDQDQGKRNGYECDEGCKAQKAQLRKMLDKREQLHVRQISSKQSELSLLQELIKDLNQQLQSFQQQLTQQQLAFTLQHQSTLSSHQQQVRDLQSTITQLKQSQTKMNKIIEQQNIQIEQNSLLDQCSKPECQTASKQLQRVKLQYLDLKGQHEILTHRYTQCHLYNQQLNLNTVQCQQALSDYEHKYHSQTDQLLSQANLNHQSILQQVQKSNQHIISDKNHQIQQLSQILASLTATNHQLHRNCRQAHHDIQSLQNQLNFVLTPLLIEHFQSLSHQ